jgi:uncharacterized protein
VSGEPDLAAGDFSAWVDGMQEALRGDAISEVPCGGCTACCTSSQFVHIGPDETATISRIPGDLLFPAPQMPEGHMVLGYDERGHCPMLIDGRCSIYEHRPRTCRTYDCRIFPASGVDPGDGGKRPIALRARRWRFRYPTAADRARHEAVRAAAAHIQEHPHLLRGQGGAGDPTRHAVLAVELHEAFLAWKALRIDPLADHLDLVEQIAGWHWDEWGPLDDPTGSAESWAAGLTGRTHRDGVPTTWLAMAGPDAVGVASLVESDMDLHTELTPWLSGLLVLPAWRGRGIGRLLTRTCETSAARFGARELHLHTSGVEPYYRRLGWHDLFTETYRGRSVTVMARRLDPVGTPSAAWS